MIKLAVLFIVILAKAFAATSASQVLELSITASQQIVTPEPVIVVPSSSSGGSSGISSGASGATETFTSSLGFYTTSPVTQKITSNLGSPPIPNVQLTVGATSLNSGTSEGSITTSATPQNIVTNIPPFTGDVLTLAYTLTLTAQLPPGNYTLIVNYTMTDQ